MKKFFKITLMVFLILFGGLLVIGAISSSKLASLAKDGGFESVEEYKKAKKENISTKKEYDAFLALQAEIDAKSAKDGGFITVDEYKRAIAVDMPTKELYDRYLVQQAELKLAGEKNKAAEAESIRSESSEKVETVAESDEKEIAAVDTSDAGQVAVKIIKLICGNEAFPNMRTLREVNLETEVVRALPQFKNINTSLWQSLGDGDWQTIKFTYVDKTKLIIKTARPPNNFNLANITILDLKTGSAEHFAQDVFKSRDTCTFY